MHLDGLALLQQKKKPFFAKSYHPWRNFSSFEQLKLRMAIEKRRAEKVHSNSAIIFLKSKFLLASDGVQQPVRIEEVALLVCATIRITDVVSIYRNPTILIFLADTNIPGAQVACKRIVNKIIERYSYNRPWTYNDFHIKMISFPYNTPGSSKLEWAVPA